MFEELEVHQEKAMAQEGSLKCEYKSYLLFPTLAVLHNLCHVLSSGRCWVMCCVVLCQTALKCYRNATYCRTAKFHTKNFLNQPEQLHTTQTLSRSGSQSPQCMCAPNRSKIFCGHLLPRKFKLRILLLIRTS